MKRVLFVSNGHGEIAIAARLALELQSRRPMLCDHLGLVGDVRAQSTMREVGPRRAMPSGGVVAMGNLRNIARDVSSGLVAHTIAQLRFLRGVRGTYDAAIAVGDVFALVMALAAGARSTVFVGTAKSVFVAPYGRFEERLLRRADCVFARDEPTAQRLREHGVPAGAANVIVDLYEDGARAVDVSFDPCFALFPGSREPAYDDAAMLARVVQAIARRAPDAGGILSIAPGIDASRMAASIARQGLRIVEGADPLEPFCVYDGARELLRAWTGSLGAMLARAAVVLGQAGTANEAAAARGIPVVAFRRENERKTPWYRMRQIGLLGAAMIVVNARPEIAADDVLSLMGDEHRRARMAAAGRERMGAPGGAALVAGAIAALVSQS